MKCSSASCFATPAVVKLFGAAVVCLLVVAASAPAQAGTYTASWTNGNNSGVWEQDGNWSTIAYPNNGHFVTINGNPYPDGSPLYNVSITTAAPCTLGLGVNVQTVSTASGTTLNIKNDVRLNVGGPFTTAGLVTLNSTGSASHLRVGNGSGVANGGVIQMSDSGSNYVSGVGDEETFTVAAGGTIRGAGQMNLGYFGGDQHLLNYINHGLIDATQPTNSLQIGLGGQQGVDANLTNDGTLRASANGTLRIHAFNTQGAVFNKGGTILAQDTGTVRIVAPVVVQGGTLDTAGSGTIRGDAPGGAGGTFKDVTNNGVMAIAVSESFTLGGNFLNNNLLRMDSTYGNSASLLLNDGTVISGNGSITLSSSPNNYMYGTSPGATVTLSAGATLQGAGTVDPGSQGTYNMNFVNHGLVDANVPPYGLTWGLDNTTNAQLTNTGTLRASNGATLRVHSFNVSGTVNNTGGTIEALDGSFARFAEAVTVNGGTITSTGTGAIHGDNPGNGGGTLNNVTSTGTLAIDDAESPKLAGTFTNNGLIRMNATQSDTSFRISGDVTLAGTGTITTSDFYGNRCSALANGSTLTIGEGQTINAAGGQFGGYTINFVNQGTINAVGAGKYALEFKISDVNNHSNFANFGTGTLNVGASRTVSFDAANTSATLSNAGSIIVGNGGTFALNNVSFLQTSGKVDLQSGTVTTPLGLDINGGVLVGNGTITGSVRNNGGNVSPGHSPGRIAIDGDYTQAAGGTLTMEIGGTDAGTYDQLLVSGTATLGGTLNIVAINGFTPKQGDVYTLVTANSFAGSFSSVNVNGFTGKIDVSSNGVTLTVTTNARQLLNISTRMKVLTGENVLIGGFIITGTEPKKVLIRGLGPELPVAGQLADPVLELHQGSTVIANNDDWRETQEQAIKDTGVPPTSDVESAMVQTLQPGSYTAIVSGKSGGTGVGQVEVYDLTAATASQLANISTRGFVDTGDNVMIGGVIVGGGSLGTTTQVLVRAIGPSLGSQGVGNALQDPTLELRDGNGQLVAQNDNWRETQEQAITATGVPPSDDRESAIVQTVAAGNYTAIVRGKDNGTGVGLVELYNLQ